MPDGDDMSGEEKKWAEAFRAGESPPGEAEWAARRRQLRAAIAARQVTVSRRRFVRWGIPAAAATVAIACGIRSWDPVAPPEAPIRPPAGAPSPDLAEAVAAAGSVASGIVDTIDRSVPLARNFLEETGRRYVAEPLLEQAVQAVQAVRTDIASGMAPLSSWMTGTRSF